MALLAPGGPGASTPHNGQLMATRLARTTTEFAVEWPVITRPTSFFSTLALPDSDGSVTAIEYSFDVIHVLDD